METSDQSEANEAITDCKGFSKCCASLVTFKGLNASRWICSQLDGTNTCVHGNKIFFALRNPLAIVTDGWVSIQNSFQSVHLDCFPEQNENRYTKAENILPAGQLLFPTVLHEKIMPGLFPPKLCTESIHYQPAVRSCIMITKTIQPQPKRVTRADRFTTEIRSAKSTQICRIICISQFPYFGA